MKKAIKSMMIALLALPMVACGDDDLPEYVKLVQDEKNSVDEGQVSVTPKNDNKNGNGKSHDVHVPGTKDLSGLSETYFEIGKEERVIEVTSKEPFCIYRVTYRINRLQINQQKGERYYDQVGIHGFMTNPDNYQKGDEFGFFRFERDNQCHIRIMIPQNDSGYARDIFFYTFHPGYYFQEDFIIPSNYAQIMIVQSAK